jgi:MFS superfamily sulfate permease-like transporter
VKIFDLSAIGVETVGSIAAGLPSLALPRVDATLFPSLLAVAAGLALVSFSNLIVTARGFAAKNGYDIDPDQDFAALGAANVASALTQGFAVSGAESRTAMSDTAGGKTNAVGLVAAAAIALVLLFFTAPLQYVPVAALGAVLVIAGLSISAACGCSIASTEPRPSSRLSPPSVLWPWARSMPSWLRWRLPCCASSSKCRARASKF